jgi:hypothetical protein
MAYLLPAEYAAYGLAAETADAWVAAASAMIDAHCKRPGLGVQSYTERLRVGPRSNAVRLSYGPVVDVTAARARFARRDGLAFAGGLAFGDELACAVEAFCAAGTWVALEVSTLDVCAGTGEVTLPINVLGAPYAQVEVTYDAGFAVVPEAVKVACAQMVRNAQAMPALNVKSKRVDTLQMEYFSDSLMDAQVVELLRPYVAERWNG